MSVPSSTTPKPVRYARKVDTARDSERGPGGLAPPPGRRALRRAATEMRRKAGLQGGFRPLGSDGLSAEAAEMVDQIEGELRRLEPLIRVLDLIFAQARPHQNMRASPEIAGAHLR